jgi:site-specific recombinase XerD
MPGVDHGVSRLQLVCETDRPVPDPVASYLARTMPGSQTTLRRVIKKASRLLGIQNTADGWGGIRYADVLRLRQLCEQARAADQMALATANHLLSVVRCVLKECWRLGLISTDDYHRAIDVPPLRGSTLPAGRALSEAEIGAMLRICREDATPLGIRDLCLLALLLSTGMRRAELVQVVVADVDLSAGRIIVRHGKGGKERLVYVASSEAQAILADWLKARGDWPGPLLSALHRTGRIQRRALAAASLYDILERRATETRIAHCTPHDFRRTFSTRLYKAGTDLLVISRLMGHARVTTTQRYVRIGQEEDVAVASRLSLPLQSSLNFLSGKELHKMTLADFVRAARTSRKLTPSVLARRAHGEVSRADLLAVEAGAWHWSTVPPAILRGIAAGFEPLSPARAADLWVEMMRLSGQLTLEELAAIRRLDMRKEHGHGNGLQA